MKNLTPYIGKLKLKIERYPWYSGTSVLNRVILDLKFITVSSRMYPDKTESGEWKVDPEKIKYINDMTGGYIADYKFNVSDNEEAELKNSFLAKDENGNTVYLGDVKIGWWYVKNKYFVVSKYPHGCAYKLKDQQSKNPTSDDNIEAVIGYTHSGGSLFRIGDKIFDSTWRGDFTEYEIERMPFSERGERLIENWNDAIEAGINLSQYLG